MTTEYEISMIAGSLGCGEYIGGKRAAFFVFGLGVAVILFLLACVFLVLIASGVLHFGTEAETALFFLFDIAAALFLGISCLRCLLKRRRIARAFRRCANGGDLKCACAQVALLGEETEKRKRRKTRNIRLRFKIEGKKYNKSSFVSNKLFLECARRGKADILYSAMYGEVFILK